MKKILYIDDCLADISLAKEAFEGSEYILDCADDTSDAYRKLHGNGHSLVVIDILMPGDDGLTFAKTLIDIDVPIILASNAMALGVFKEYTNIRNYLGFILKPVTPEKIEILQRGGDAQI